MFGDTSGGKSEKDAITSCLAVLSALTLHLQHTNRSLSEPKPQKGRLSLVAHYFGRLGSQGWLSKT